MVSEDDSFRPPCPLVLQGNLAEKWRRWEQAFRVYLTASGADRFSAKRQVAVLLNCVGEEAVQIYETFGFPDDETQTVDEVLEEFQKYCTPRKNVIFERYSFWNYPWKVGDTVECFVTELKLRAGRCEFGSAFNELVRDKLVFSAPERLQQKLLKESDLTLEKAVEICQIEQITANQLSEMSTMAKQFDETAEIRENFEVPVQTLGNVNSRLGQRQDYGGYKGCFQCGSTNKPQKCPALGKVCHKCGRKNHFARMCKTSATGVTKDQRRRQVHDMDLHSLFIGVLSQEMDTVAVQPPGWFADIFLRGLKVQFKLDTGAEANVLPVEIYDKIPGQKSLAKTKTTLMAYGGTRIVPLGTIALETSTTKRSLELLFYVTDISTTPLLGRVACEALNLVCRVDNVQQPELVSKEQLVTMYSDVFEGLGEFEGSYHIELNPSVPPVIHACRKVPYGVLDRLKETLCQMEAAEVIYKVECPTEWVSSLVITEKKNGKLRVCLDPRDLNKAISRQHYTIPTTDDVLSSLAGKRFFTIVDEKDGYWQVKLDEKSALLCTFNTPWGRYRFNRMPFGLKSSSEVFQQKNEETFGHIEGVHMIADDMIIAAETSQEHDQILRKVFETARAKNIKFNKEKIQFKVDSVKYMGHIITAQGVKVDEEKVKAIREMPSPQDRQGVLRFLGSVQYLSKYIPREAELTAPLRNLLKKNVLFQWMPEHQKSFEIVKQQLCRAPVLQYFDASKPLVVQADASKNGLGACLLQEGRPICYASRALTMAEQNYAQIEKELLAVLYAIRKFHQYVFGKLVLVQTDHKPLEAICKKALGSAPARLQRMLLQLQRYQMEVKYVPGKEMYLADTLSRATVDPPESDVEPIDDEKVIYEIGEIVMHPTGVRAIQEATKQDIQLQEVASLISRGWPLHLRDVPSAAKAFWAVKDLLRCQDGVLYVDERVVIPVSQRRTVLEQLHESHQGMQRTKMRAKTIMYWPGMGKEIETFIENCSICARCAPKNQKEPLIPHEIPELPWEKLGVDIFEYRMQPFLLVIDYFSKYPELVGLPDKTAGAVISRLKAVFARHGIPRIVITDNMPFASQEFQQFAQGWGFEQRFSSPGYPQSNGMVERAIQSIKLLLKKAEQTHKEPQLALLEYRNTPVTGLEYSPAQLLMGRVLRSKLPVTEEVLRPKIPVGVRESLKRNQERQKYFYDSTARPLRPLEEGDPVWFESTEGWSPAVVTRKCDQPRTYRVVTSSGRVYRRNRRRIRPRSVQTEERRGRLIENSKERQRDNNGEGIGRIPDAQIDARQPRYVTSYGRCVYMPQRYMS